MGVGVVVGGAVSSSYYKSLGSAEAQAKKLGERWEKTNKRASAVGDLVRYRAALDTLRRKQGEVGASTTRVPHGRIDACKGSCGCERGDLRANGVHLGLELGHRRLLLSVVALPFRGHRERCERCERHRCDGEHDAFHSLSPLRSLVLQSGQVAGPLVTKRTLSFPAYWAVACAATAEINRHGRANLCSAGAPAHGPEAQSNTGGGQPFWREQPNFLKIPSAINDLRWERARKSPWSAASSLDAFRQCLWQPSH